MRSLTSPISSTDADRLWTASVVALASPVAWLAGRNDGLLGLVAVVDRFEFELAAVDAAGAIGLFE
ncbi:MAG TPA: hypothetical protein VIY07_14590, partial [Pseudolabrys sp.]